jgi:hypothetical protein
MFASNPIFEKAKMFAKIVRFKQALRRLRNYPHEDLLSIAIE